MSSSMIIKCLVSVPSVSVIVLAIALPGKSLTFTNILLNIAPNKQASRIERNTSVDRR